MKRRLVSASVAAARGWFIGHEIPWGEEVDVLDTSHAWWVKCRAASGVVHEIRKDAFEGADYRPASQAQIDASLETIFQSLREFFSAKAQP